MQELLASSRDELLATTQLPMAVDFLRTELLHCGQISTAMERLPHYFTGFQTYVVAEAESEQGRFDMRVALEVLRKEAKYRGKEGGREGIFMYQFETLCRNRLSYDRGLAAMASDPIYDEPWQQWLLGLRRQIGLVDFADVMYVHSQYYLVEQAKRGKDPPADDHPLLFGEKEGRIALANRRKDPLLLFAALQRHLDYPAVPRPMAVDASQDLLPQVLRRLERMEFRLKLMEDEQKGGIDLAKFFGPPA